MPSTSVSPELDLGVDPDYHHAPKHVSPGELLSVKGSQLKWYAVHPADRPVPDNIARLARTFLIKTQLAAQGLGFVILHRCGADFYFLIVSTWRNNNELWETVFYKNGDAMDDFALFPREVVHLPTFCVWELVPLWHEQKAWVQFLGTARDNAAIERWRSDFYQGAA